jgi:hypothetical protein
MIGGSGSAASATLDYSDGDSFNVELYAAAGIVASFSGLSPIPSTITTLADGSYGPAYAGMYFPTGSGIVTFGGTSGTPGAPTVAIGSPVTLALAAWFNGAGSFPTLASAQASGGASLWGVSPVGTEHTGGGNASPPFLPGLGNPNTLAGWITSFNIVGPDVIPEPSTVAHGSISFPDAYSPQAISVFSGTAHQSARGRQNRQAKKRRSGTWDAEGTASNLPIAKRLAVRLQNRLNDG